MEEYKGTQTHFPEHFRKKMVSFWELPSRKQEAYTRERLENKEEEYIKAWLPGPLQEKEGKEERFPAGKALGHGTGTPAGILSTDKMPRQGVPILGLGIDFSRSYDNLGSKVNHSPVPKQLS